MTTLRSWRFAVHQGARRAEHYQARLAKIEYERARGQARPKDEVQVAAFNKFRPVSRSHPEHSGSRAAMVAAETEAAKCYAVLATEIRRALN